MEFEFNKELVAQNLIDIPRIGSFAMQAEGAMGDAYFLVIRTLMGRSYIATCGPVLPGIEELPPGFTTNLTVINFNEGKLIKTINMFLNDHSKGIYRAEIVDFNTALNEFRDLGIFMQEKFKEKDNEENGEE